MLGRRLLLEGVLGDVDVDRAGPAGPGDVERLGDDPRQVVGVADQVVVLGHRQGDAVDVDLLEGVLADERRRDVAGDRDHRDRVEQGRADPGDEVGGARPGGAHAHADPAGDPGVAVGRVGAALLVADEDVAQLGIVAEDVVERQDDAARVAEEDVDALAEERLADHVGADPGPLARLDLVEHRVAGLLHGGRVGRAVGGDVAPTRTGGRHGAAVNHGRPGRRRAAAVRRPLRHRHRVRPSMASVPSSAHLTDRVQETTKPPPPGEGPVGSRWRSSLPPRSSVLPPGAGNQPKKAVQPKEERAKKSEGRYQVEARVDRHVHAAAISRHDDGDAAAVLAVEQTQVGLRVRAIATASDRALFGQSSSLR